MRHPPDWVYLAAVAACVSGVALSGYATVSARLEEQSGTALPLGQKVVLFLICLVVMPLGTAIVVVFAGYMIFGFAWLVRRVCE